MTQRTIYLLNVLGIVAILALNGVLGMYPGAATSYIATMLIPLAWLLGSWYGRADTVAGLKRIVHVDWANGPDKSVVQYRRQTPDEKPYPLLCFQHGGSPVAAQHNHQHGFTCPKCQAQGAASIGVLPDGADPLDAEKVMAELSAQVDADLRERGFQADHIDSSHPSDH